MAGAGGASLKQLALCGPLPLPLRPRESLSLQQEESRHREPSTGRPQGRPHFSPTCRFPQPPSELYPQLPPKAGSPTQPSDLPCLSVRTRGGCASHMLTRSPAALAGWLRPHPVPLADVCLFPLTARP